MGSNSSTMRRQAQLDKTHLDGKFVSSTQSIKYGGAAMQGWRPGMEDAMSIYHENWQEDGFLMFAVFDGHGGDRTSMYSAEHLGPFLWQEIRARDGQVDARMLQHAFLEFDWTLCTTSGQKQKHMSCGSTATVVLIDLFKERLFLAHLGDSRGLIFKRPGSILYETRDHVPADPVEAQRITSLSREDDGYEGITLKGRRVFVGGCSSLNVCRGFGDHDFKRSHGVHQSAQAVSAMPDCYEVRLPRQNGERLFVVIASDGIWGAKLTGKKFGVPAQMHVNSQIVRYLHGEAMRASHLSDDEDEASELGQGLAAAAPAPPGKARVPKDEEEDGAYRPEDEEQSLMPGSESAGLPRMSAGRRFSDSIADVFDDMIAKRGSQPGKSTDNMAMIFLDIAPISIRGGKPHKHHKLLVRPEHRRQRSVGPADNVKFYEGGGAEVNGEENA